MCSATLIFICPPGRDLHLLSCLREKPLNDVMFRVSRVLWPILVFVPAMKMDELALLHLSWQAKVQKTVVQCTLLSSFYYSYLLIANSVHLIETVISAAICQRSMWTAMQFGIMYDLTFLLSGGKVWGCWRESTHINNWQIATAVIAKRYYASLVPSFEMGLTTYCGKQWISDRKR